MGTFQIYGFVIFMPFSMFAAPILLMYQTSLMGKKDKLLGRGATYVHLIPALYSLTILIVGLFIFQTEEVNEILTIQKLNTQVVSKNIARWVLVSAHIVWYIQLFVYNKKIQKTIKTRIRIIVLIHMQPIKTVQNGKSIFINTPLLFHHCF